MGTARFLSASAGDEVLTKNARSLGRLTPPYLPLAGTAAVMIGCPSSGRSTRKGGLRAWLCDMVQGNCSSSAASTNRCRLVTVAMSAMTARVIPAHPHGEPLGFRASDHRHPDREPVKADFNWSMDLTKAAGLVPFREPGPKRGIFAGFLNCCPNYPGAAGSHRHALYRDLRSRQAYPRVVSDLLPRRASRGGVGRADRHPDVLDERCYNAAPVVVRTFSCAGSRDSVIRTSSYRGGSPC